MKGKHLDGRGKGEVDYDYKNDILFFKTKGREYKKSIDFGNLVLDIDKEDFITGIQIFDASKMFKMAKEVLRNIKQWEFNAKTEENTIIIQLAFKALQRNKIMGTGTHNFERDAPLKMENSEVLCTVA